MVDQYEGLIKDLQEQVLSLHNKHNQLSQEMKRKSEAARKLLSERDEEIKSLRAFSHQHQPAVNLAVQPVSQPQHVPATSAPRSEHVESKQEHHSTISVPSTPRGKGNHGVTSQPNVPVHSSNVVVDPSRIEEILSQEEVCRCSYGYFSLPSVH